MDTDSIFTTGTLPHHIVDPTRLGAWKLEYKANDVQFYARKCYSV